MPQKTPNGRNEYERFAMAVACQIYLTAKKRKVGSGKTYDKFADVHFPNPHTVDWSDRKSLLALNQFDYTCPEFKETYRKIQNFIQADCLFLDFDHIIPEPDLEQWKNASRQIAFNIKINQAQCAVAVIPSISKTGCHVLIPFDRPIRNAAEYGHACVSAMSLEPSADEAVKDAARFSFCANMPDAEFLQYAYFLFGDPVPVDYLLKIKAPRPAQEVRHFDRSYTGNIMDGISFAKGGRNANCLKLACRLLNRYPEGEARENYLALTADCDLPQSEMDTVWSHAVQSMIGRGLAYRTPPDHTAVYIDAETTVPNKRRGQTLSDMEDLRDRFLDYYARFGLKMSINTLKQDLERFRDDGGRVTADTLIQIPALCEQWAMTYIPQSVKDALGDLCPKGKTVSEIIDVLAEYIGTTKEPIMYLEATGEWKQFNPREAKWITISPKLAFDTIVSALGEMRSRILYSGVTDQSLQKTLQRAADSSSLLHTACTNLTVRYEQIQQTEPYIVATPAGKIDLRKGMVVLPTLPTDYVLGTTRFSLPETPIQNGLWERTVHAIIPDPEEYEWFRMVMGSQMTGKLKRDGMYFWKGDGANGKSTIFDTIAFVMGDYAGTIDPEVLGRGLNKRDYDYGRATVMGKRIMLCSEAGPDMVLDPAQTKRLTSAHDPISASLKYRNTFEFFATHTINWIANELPSLINVRDYGLTRRILGIFIFKQTFTGKKADGDLNRKLKEECGSEVLQWLIQAGIDYVKNGERIPPMPKSQVENITNYKEEQSYFAHFIDDCFEKDQLFGVPADGVLYMYGLWSKNLARHGERMNLVAIGKQMNAEGYPSKRIRINGHLTRVYDGLKFNKSSFIWKLMKDRDFRNSEVPFEDAILH